MIDVIFAMALSVSSIEAEKHPVANESVVCLENGSSDETMWIALGEKYLSGNRTVRQVELAPGKKRCLRYDRVRNVVVNHYYLSEAQRRVETGDKIDPWRLTSCDRVKKNTAVFLTLGSDENGKMTCEADSSRDDSTIRGFVAGAKPFSM